MRRLLLALTTLALASACSGMRPGAPLVVGTPGPFEAVSLAYANAPVPALHRRASLVRLRARRCGGDEPWPEETRIEPLGQAQAARAEAPGAFRPPSFQNRDTRRARCD